MSDAPKHATYGPSTLKHREICPGWTPDRSGDTTKADEGTAMHEGAEKEDLTGLNEEQAACVQTVINYVKRLLVDVVEDYRELKLNILNGLSFGTADRVIVRRLSGSASGYHVDIVDFKFGFGHIDDADRNRQGIAYVLGVWEKFPRAESITVHFLIPRRDEVLRHTFTRKDRPQLVSIIRNIIERCKLYAKTRDEKMLNPVGIACQYCGAIATCPKHNALAVTIGKQYAPLELVDEVHSSQITDPQKMARAYELACVMEKWAGSVKSHAREMYLNGTEIPGYEMRERAGTREITHPVMALPVLTEFLTPEEILLCAKLSLSKLEKLVSEKTPKGTTKKSNIARFNTALLAADAVTSGEPTRYLAKIKD